jgi:hypothetical protein
LKFSAWLALLFSVPLALAAAGPKDAPHCPVGEPSCAARVSLIKKLFGVDEAQFNRELQARFNPAPPPPPAELVDPHAGQLADARYFEAFPDFDRSYSPAARHRAKRLTRLFARDAEHLSHEQFVLHIAEITALAANGHTAIGEDALRKDTPRIPVRTFLFADGLRILRTSPALQGLLGARVDRIDGRPIAALYTGLRKYLPGEEGRRRLQLLPVLESPALLQAAGLADRRDALTLQGVLADGTSFTQQITAERRNRAAPVSNTMRLLFPDDAAARMTAYLRTGASVPVSLRDSAHLFSTGDLPNGGFYIGLTSNMDSDDQPLGAFLADVLVRVKQQHPRFVVLDMRMNGGGDYTKSYDFARALPVAAGRARIYALTSPWTFSAAITTVAALKDAGGRRVTIVGERVGDQLSFWAEGGRFDLPNSGITAFFATGRHNYRRPCTDRQSCFWLNELYPVRVRTLEPDVLAPMTFAAYSMGRDPGLDAILTRERH